MGMFEGRAKVVFAMIIVAVMALLKQGGVVDSNGSASKSPLAESGKSATTDSDEVSRASSAVESRDPKQTTQLNYAADSDLVGPIRVGASSRSQ